MRRAAPRRAVHWLLPFAENNAGEGPQRLWGPTGGPVCPRAQHTQHRPRRLRRALRTVETWRGVPGPPLWRRVIALHLQRGSTCKQSEQNETTHDLIIIFIVGLARREVGRAICVQKLRGFGPKTITIPGYTIRPRYEGRAVCRALFRRQ